MIRSGVVYLVGAGPGDTGLVTRRALELVRAADVIYADRLIPASLLDEAQPGARIVDVGKVAGDHAMPQEEINDALAASARHGHVVVRLKGGDPYLFGRGGEEGFHLRRLGVPFEVVPGVPSPIAASSTAGIPVTHRDVARNVTIVTASAGRDGQGDPDYPWLAQSDGTVVLLMGLRRVAHVAEQLIAGGAPPSRPAAVVAQGTLPGQRVVTGTLATIANEVRKAALPSPAIIVVGDVVDMREHLDWFGSRPLAGRRIAVTRARAQASQLSHELRSLGAEVVEAPTISIEPAPPDELDRVVRDIESFGTVVLTSRNGVDLFFKRIRACGRDVRALHGVRIAVVGAASAAACLEHGVDPDVVPPVGSRTSAGLVDALAHEPIFGTRIAVVRAAKGDDRLLEGLEALGARPELVVAYTTLVEQPGPATIDRVLGADLVTFTSESTVTHLVAALPADRPRPPCVTIGPITTKAALWHGFEVLAEADDPSIESLVACVVAQVPSLP